MTKENVDTQILSGPEGEEMDMQYQMLFGVYAEQNGKKLDKVIMKTKKFVMTITRAPKE